MARLLLVRHGETDLHSGRTFVGQRDVELNSAGQQQVKKLAHPVFGPRRNHRVVEIEQISHTSEQPEKERGRQRDPARPARLDFGGLFQADDRCNQCNDHENLENAGCHVSGPEPRR